MWKNRIRAAGNSLRRSPLVFNALKRLYLFLPKSLRSTDSLPYMIDRFASRIEDGFFLQIGSNDGVAGDPLSAFIEKHRWRGLCIEPNPAMFEQLRANRGKYPGLDFDCVAIGEVDAERDFYIVDTDRYRSLPAVVDQFGSFSREMILDKLRLWEVSDPEEKILALKVPTLTLKSLYKKHGIERVNLLHIDAEGHDLQILRQVDFQAKPPGMVIFEHMHIDAKGLEECWELLADYSIAMERFDVVATHKSVR